jgi:hypothetical protein
MKKTLVSPVMSVCLLALGLTLIGCPEPENGKNDDNNAGNNGQKEPKIITITGITGKTGYLSIGVYDQDGDFVAIGWPTEIKNNSASVPLTTMEMPPVSWTGSGSYCIFLGIGASTAITTDDESYFYTDGNPLPASMPEEEFFNALPKCNITQPETEIPFNKFVLAE